MRRRSINIATVFSLFLVTTIVSCENEKIVFSGPYHVRFTESADFVKESYTQPIQIEVHSVGPALNEDLTINYKISGDAREGIDYVILGTRGKVEIESGEYFGHIEIQMMNNANNILRNQDIIFTLESTSNNELEVGQGESGIGKSFTFTIFDDCILGGTYTGTSTSNQVDGIPITSSDCENYTLANWNISIPDSVYGFSDPLDLVFIDNGDNTLTIPKQVEDSFEPGRDTIQGTGSVNPTTRQIQMKVRLINYHNAEVLFSLIPE